MFNFLVLSWALSLGIVPQQDDQVRGQEAIIEKSQAIYLAIHTLQTKQNYF